MDQVVDRSRECGRNRSWEVARNVIREVGGDGNKKVGFRRDDEVLLSELEVTTAAKDEEKMKLLPQKFSSPRAIAKSSEIREKSSKGEAEKGKFVHRKYFSHIPPNLPSGEEGFSCLPCFFCQLSKSHSISILNLIKRRVS